MKKPHSYGVPLCLTILNLHLYNSPIKYYAFHGHDIKDIEYKKYSILKILNTINHK